jgi:hypothetical protein
VGAGAAEPPPDPEPGVGLLDPLSFFFFFDDEGVVTPPESGVVVGWKVGGGVDLSLPPLDAMATTTIRKKRAPPRATSLRRR